MPDQPGGDGSAQLRFVNPCGPTSPISETGTGVEWPTHLDGLAIGFLGNGKSNVAGFLDHLSSMLASRGAKTACSLAKEGPMADCGEHRYREFQDRCDLVIVGV